jgi:hypothetical protein
MLQQLQSSANAADTQPALKKRCILRASAASTLVGSLSSGRKLYQDLMYLSVLVLIEWPPPSLPHWSLPPADYVRSVMLVCFRYGARVQHGTHLHAHTSPLRSKNVPLVTKKYFG